MLDAASYTPRLKTYYTDTVRAALKEEFSYKNEMMIPKLEKSTPMMSTISLIIFEGTIGRLVPSFVNRL